jgi:hypothetical protein
MPSKKPTAEQLRKANIHVIGPSGALQRIAPADDLKDNIERYLPPAGPYYDQSVLGASTEMSKKGEKCVFCWNANVDGKECKCKKKCALCDTKEHRGFECPKLYASMRWWHKRQHHPRRKARVRPNPAERAYLVIAGVLKVWKVLDEPVNVNMSHPVVKAHYKGKKAPQALASLRNASQPASATIAAQLPAIPLIFEPDADEATATGGEGTNVSTPPKGPLEQLHKVNTVVAERHVKSGGSDEISSAISRERTGIVSTVGDASFLDGLLEDVWPPPSYHEGLQRATLTPLSIRLAFATVQRLATIQDPIVSIGNEIRPELDPRLKTRSPLQPATGAICPPTTVNAALNHVHCEREIRKTEDEFKRCYKELENARDEIRSKDRRIRKLEIALHEQEGWTDAVTYRVGGKRSRK